jgi:hypothetical protein
MHFTKYNWNITLYFACEFWFTKSKLYWIGHWYHITSICEGFYEPNAKAIESWNYMMCFVIWPSVNNLIPRIGRRHVCEIIKKHVLQVLYNLWNSAKSHRQNAWNRISETLDFKIRLEDKLEWLHMNFISLQICFVWQDESCHTHQVNLKTRINSLKQVHMK